MRQKLVEAAHAYVDAGLSVIPTRRLEKSPCISWKPYQTRLPSEKELNTWFSRPNPCVAIVAGLVSGSLEMLDFDQGAELFNAWADRIRDEEPGLLERLVIERSQSGGCHVVYRCSNVVIPGNQKLALRAIEANGPEEVEIVSKRYKPRRVRERWIIELTLIETRGEGGYFLAAPSPGYEILQGDFTALPEITIEERGALLAAARSLSELAAPAKARVATMGLIAKGVERPGDDFNRRGGVRAILERHGWTPYGLETERGGSCLQHYTRPGKRLGISATLFNGAIFHCFTSNGAPFQPWRSYTRFGVYAELEHDGNYAKAARALALEGYGKP